MNANEAAWLHFWEGLATFGFLLVIVGCVIEGVEHFKKFKRGENAKKHLIEKIGWFILIGGLAIEFLADNRAKRLADKENTRLTTEASRANERAGIAHELASAANERASSNELKRVELELELRKFTAPRTITNEKSNAFILAVKNLPKGPVRLGVNWPDRETQRFGSQLAELLIAAGYPLKGLGNYGEPVPYTEDFNMAILVADPFKAPPFSAPLQQALSDIGFGTLAYTNLSSRFPVATNEMLILIGPKW